ncbi:IclR family transcriptional regulator [Nocardioides sp.]|uniref:IclR family transcriptional regulator n=1 Tax=Nocardioides sp. TaxID=35761 RepID=UPI00286E0948|nr:IclR family transcriptional regulator [Nocardioides sp.]
MTSISDAGRRPSARRNSSGLSRDVELLDVLASPESQRAGGLRVLRIAELLDRDKAVVSRALATLADAGIVDRDPKLLTYRLGPRLYALAARTTEATLAHGARPVLRQMVQAVRETTHLCVLRGGNVLTLLSELSPQEVGTTGWAGTTTAAWRTPSGRVLISDWDRPSVDAWYAEHGRDAALVDPGEARWLRPFPVLAEPPAHKVVVRNLQSLHTELARIRARGYAVLDEELEEGVVGASAPVWDATGSIIAAINVSAPRARMGGRLDDLGSYVARCATALSESVGREP